MGIGHDNRTTRETPPAAGPRVSRRGFLTAAGATAAAFGAPGGLASAAAAQGDEGHGHHRDRIPAERISIQLYTLRDQLAIDLQGTL